LIKNYKRAPELTENENYQYTSKTNKTVYRTSKGTEI